MSPRKPSTSSGKPSPPRPRYLGLEAAGEPFPPPKLLESALRRALAGPENAPTPPVRVIRVEHRRAIAEIPHLELARARAAWNGALELPGRGTMEIRTRRTWGTLLLGKRWLRTPPSALRSG